MCTYLQKNEHVSQKAVFVSKDGTNMNARVAEEPSLEYGKTQLLSHPSLLKTFGFSAISTYDSYLNIGKIQF